METGILLLLRANLLIPLRVACVESRDSRDALDNRAKLTKLKNKEIYASADCVCNKINKMCVLIERTTHNYFLLKRSILAELDELFKI
jgi:hypothetical protein